MTDAADPSQTSVLFARWTDGDQKAVSELVAHLYRDIHAIAVRELRSERRLNTWQTTAIRRFPRRSHRS